MNRCTAISELIGKLEIMVAKPSKSTKLRDATILTVGLYVRKWIMNSVL